MDQKVNFVPCIVDSIFTIISAAGEIFSIFISFKAFLFYFIEGIVARHWSVAQLGGGGNYEWSLQPKLLGGGPVPGPPMIDAPWTLVYTTHPKRYSHVWINVQKTFFLNVLVQLH